ncbi:MAG: response regulator [Phycisphaeraceae bacterium]|nr:response regulator [Phycisphaeraceae bacterium]
MNCTRPISLVVIDDDPSQLQLLVKRLKDPDPCLSVGEVYAYSEAVDAITNMPVDGPVAILCDFDMPGGSGLDWLADLIQQNAGPVLMVTATGNEQVAADAFKLGVSDYLLKTEVMSDIGKLKHSIADAVRRFDLAKRNKQFARELKLTNHQLQERNRVLSEMTSTAHRFVDNVAHDFRTPLTVIREFTSILTDEIGGTLTKQQVEFLGHIDTSARELNAMVDDFLDSSKLKAQTLCVRRQVVTVQALFDRIKPTLETNAGSKSIRIEFEADAPQAEVFVDSEKIGRVLVNIAFNAIKFSPEASTVRITAKAEGEDQVFFAVYDQGVGISEEELPSVCERFSQVDDPRRSVAKGFGLGLNIARDLVWVNLGQMRITSELGKGSMFGFTVPRNQPESVMKRYIQRMIESDEDEPMTLLRVSPYNPNISIDDLHEELAASCRSMDLLIPVPQDRSVYVIGPSEKPDRWIQTLRDAAQRSDRAREQSNPLNLTWLGTWPQQAAKEEAVALLNDPNSEEKACA